MQIFQKQRSPIEPRTTSLAAALAFTIALNHHGASAQTVLQNNPPITVSPPITNSVNPRAVANPTAQGGVGQGGVGQGGMGQGGQSASGASANPAASSIGSTVTFQSGNNSPLINNIPGNAPTVYVPSVATGNVCALGASAGGSWIAASIAFGMSWESMQCERRQAAALLWNMNTPESRAAAKEVICNTPEIRAAYAVIGSPCAADLSRIAGVQPQQAAAPQQIAPPAAVAFSAAQYAKASDCLTAAMAQGAPRSLCAGKQ